MILNVLEQLVTDGMKNEEFVTQVTVDVRTRPPSLANKHHIITTLKTRYRVSMMNIIGRITNSVYQQRYEFAYNILDVLKD